MNAKSQGLCETTLTERFDVGDKCSCDTYAGNLGPCIAFDQGENGRCVYCDHTKDCHSFVVHSQTPWLPL